MDLALAEAGQGLAAQELALDFLPGLACAAAYACGPSSAPSQPSGQGKEKEKEKTPREKDNKGPSPHHSSSHKDKASSDKASSSGRRAGNVKLAPVPSPELLGALADLTAHMRRFHTSQVGSTSRTRSYILSFHSLITDTHRRSYHCTHLLTRPPAHLFTPDLPTTHPSTHPPTHPPIPPDQPGDPRPGQKAFLPPGLLPPRQHARGILPLFPLFFFWSVCSVLCPRRRVAGVPGQCTGRHCRGGGQGS